MKKIILIIEAMIAIVIVGLAIFLFLPKETDAPVVTPLADIELFSPKPGDVISSPLKITGVVRGNGWNGFEGQVGTVQVLDASGSELAVTYLPATTEWTALPTNFEASLEFVVTSETFGSLVFHNENASGDPERDKTFTVPVKFK